LPPVAALDRGLDVARRSGNRLAERLIAIKLATLQAQSGDTRVALERFDDLIPLWRTSRDSVFVLTLIASLVLLFERLGQLETVATLYGALPPSTERSAVVLELEKASTRLRATLGDSAFAVTTDRGRAMAIDDAVEFARAGVVASLRKVGSIVSSASPSDR
jgi:hypothetical protein